MIVYFDTNIIISSSVSELIQITKNLNVKITALNYVELLGRLEKDFNNILSCFKKINSFTIDWRFPEDIIMESVGSTFIYKDERTSSLKNILEICLSESSLINIKEKCDNVQFSLNKYFTQYEKLLEVDSKHEKERIKQFKNNPDKSLLLNLTSEEIKFYTHSILKSILGFCLNSIHKNINKNEIDNLIKSYNENINSYLRSYAYYEATKIVNNESMSRNDLIDLNHLLYLGKFPNDTVLISNDKLFQKIKSVIKGQILKREDLLNYKK